MDLEEIISTDLTSKEEKSNLVRRHKIDGIFSSKVSKFDKCNIGK